MSKPFNIHDWQADQHQIDESRMDTPGGNPDYFYDGFKKLRYHVLLNNLNDEGKLHRWGIVNLQNEFNLSEEEAKVVLADYLKEKQSGMQEHHNDEESPGKDLSAFDLLDKIKNADQDLYNKLESFMKQMDENSLGTGSSVSAGTGAAYATPKAFAKKDKWKNKTYKYEQ